MQPKYCSTVASEYMIRSMYVGQETLFTEKFDPRIGILPNKQSKTALSKVSLRTK